MGSRASTSLLMAHNLPGLLADSWLESTILIVVIFLWFVGRFVKTFSNGNVKFRLVLLLLLSHNGATFLTDFGFVCNAKSFVFLHQSGDKALVAFLQILFLLDFKLLHVKCSWCGGVSRLIQFNFFKVGFLFFDLLLPLNLFEFLSSSGSISVESIG
jgi:hypothetical protein